MPKMVRWEKVEGTKIPTYMREAISVYKDTESIFYLGNFDSSNGTAIEHRWKVADKEGTVLKGQYNCCGFKLNFPPIKWATKVVDNKHEVFNDNDNDNDNEELDDDDNREEDRDYGIGNSEQSEEASIQSSFESIIAAVQEEGQIPEEPVKKRRGRKPGSKNKPKTGQPLTVKKSGRGRLKGSKDKTKRTRKKRS